MVNDLPPRLNREGLNSGRDEAVRCTSVRIKGHNDQKSGKGSSFGSIQCPLLSTLFPGGNALSVAV